MVEKQKQAEQKLKEAHLKLKNLNKNLEKLVSQRTNELSKAIKLKDEFIHQLGHDLKTPLGPLISLLPIIEKHTQNPKEKEMLTVVQRNVYYMKNLVKKTLELAQLNSPTTSFNLEKLSLNDLILEIEQKNSSMFQKQHVNLMNTIPEDLNIYADGFQICEVFDNLFNNAIKYRKEEDVTIRLAAEKKNGQVLISVTDDGRGISPKQMENIFDEFYKADQSRHDFDSSGLGLPICKRIVEKHGGKIWVESDGIGRGSIFYFTLPVPV
jgi:signal transduction histidine kinase